MRSVKLVALVIILIVAGATSPLYVMLLTAEDPEVSAAESPLVSDTNDTGSDDECREGRIAIPIPDGGLFWQETLLCGKGMRYWSGEGEPPGPIINMPARDFD